jgi:hypothetical protein
MNRDFFLKYIAEVERHIIESKAPIQRQHEIIARLRENGSDTTHAERLLDNTFGVLAAHERYLAYLRGLLAKHGHPSPKNVGDV